MRCGIIGSCQSAATSEIVKALLVTSLTQCKRRYNKCPDLYLYLLTVGDSVVLFFFSLLSFFLFNFIRCPCNVFDVIVSP